MLFNLFSILKYYLLIIMLMACIISNASSIIMSGHAVGMHCDTDANNGEVGHCQLDPMSGDGRWINVRMYKKNQLALLYSILFMYCIVLYSRFRRCHCGILILHWEAKLKCMMVVLCVGSSAYEPKARWLVPRFGIPPHNYCTVLLYCTAYYQLKYQCVMQ
jgi:hypothetical protein